MKILLYLIITLVFASSIATSEWIDGPIKSDNQGDSIESTSDQVLIGAFNIRKFGMSKVNKQNVVDILIKILMRYDMIAISEITDVTEKAIKKLIGQLNYVSLFPYHYVVSERIGRTRNKEQYALIYRPTVITVKEHFVYNDSKNDPFAREPLVATFQINGKEPLISLITVHVKPSDAVAEINALLEVQNWVEKRLKVKNVIILGDLNADCSYVRKKDWKSILLRNSTRHTWLIDDEEDTTVAKTDCAYDRIIISGAYLNSAVIPESAKAYKFDDVYSLNQEEALDVSDHYPVEVALRIGNSAAISSSKCAMKVLTLYYFFISTFLVAFMNSLLMV